MKHKRLLMMCGFGLAAASALAAGTHAQADPISGKWGQGQTALLDIAYDGKGGVSGTIFLVRDGTSKPFPIRTGTFDTATGALLLTGEVVVPDRGPTPYRLEGTLAGGALSMSYTFGDDKGTASLTRVTGAAAPAKDVAPAKVTKPPAALLKHFTDVSSLVLKAAELVPADKYSYRPAPTVRTFGELVAHIAESYGYYCGPAGGQNAASTTGGTDKVALVKRLKDATGACTSSTTADDDAMIGNIAHTNLHYGNMVTYMRMLGLVPPSS
jgi:hypothetical protein